MHFRESQKENGNLIIGFGACSSMWMSSTLNLKRRTATCNRWLCEVACLFPQPSENLKRRTAALCFSNPSFVANTLPESQKENGNVGYYFSANIAQPRHDFFRISKGERQRWWAPLQGLGRCLWSSRISKGERQLIALASSTSSSLHLFTRISKWERQQRVRDCYCWAYTARRESQKENGNTTVPSSIALMLRPKNLKRRTATSFSISYFAHSPLPRWISKGERQPLTRCQGASSPPTNLKRRTASFF